MALENSSNQTKSKLTNSDALYLLPITSHEKHLNNAETVSDNLQYEEITIPVPWGHIAGKWWGPKDRRPIIGLHGWQDNAGTFDTLIPLLSQDVSFLCIDLPGHGFSSRIPDGMSYNLTDFLYTITMIMKEYNWDRVSLMGHSMGSIIAFLFAATFPEKVDMLISIDGLRRLVSPVPEIIKSMRSRVETFLIADERNQEKSEPPCYTYDGLIEKLYAATIGSVYKESCKYLLARNMQKSSKYPDKYYFRRDSRLKALNFGTISQEVSLDLAERIIAPHLFIKSRDSSHHKNKRYLDECIKVLKKSSKFEFHYVKGTHHLHLNEPAKVSGIINAFINKYRPPEAVSKL